MGTSRRDDQSRVNAFEIGGLYVFKYYFAEDDVFGRLKEYYNNHEYRFEVPIGDFSNIQNFLEEFGYNLVAVSDIEEFVIVKEKYTNHPEDIFKKSVIKTNIKDYNVFLMKDKSAVETMLREGAVRITELPVENPFTS